MSNVKAHVLNKQNQNISMLPNLRIHVRDRWLAWLFQAEFLRG